ncbi:MAG: molybdopterin-dependent oxidoreductase, partial [Zetaproteobacteria bacterium]|nr:molybdopterin-dependent oxidoreductase [Flavobacteriales bacterium]
PAIDVVGSAKQTGKTGSFNKRQTRVDKLPEFTGEFPVVALADEILTPGNGQVKALVSIAGNPVLSTPNGTKLEQALESLEFMVAIDIYLNETTKHANIILPPTTGLETSIYDLVFHQFAIKNTVAYAPALFEKEPNQRHDWEIFKALTARLSGKENPLNLEQTLDYLLQFSYYNEPKLSVKELLKHPHGIDFGNLKPQLPDRLFTSDKKIDLTPDLLVADLKRLDKILSVKANKTYPFYLIGRRQLRSNNSWMHNSERLSKGKNRCTLLINSDDAKILKLFNGQKACVSSNVGSLTIEIETTSKIKRGVVSIPHGWGHHRKETKLSIAQKNAGVSLNDLTDTNRIDALTGNADFSGTRVRIEPIN